MTTGFLVKDCKVGIVMENDGAGFVGDNADGVGSLYDSADQTYAVLSWHTDVTIDSIGLEQQTFQCNDDNYDHDIDIKNIGGGSVSAIAIDDTVAGGLDAYNIWYAAAHLPNGNSLAAAAVDMAWNATLDTNAGVKASDLRGYAIVIEKKDEKSTPVYYTWVFHNCKISSTPAFSPKQAAVVNLTWSDARDFSISTGAATFANHSDA